MLQLHARLGQQRETKSRLDEVHPAREGLLESKVNAERDFAAMAGGDAASELAEEVQQALATLRGLVARYTRVKLARRVLADEIERLRRRHRDPILGRASATLNIRTPRGAAERGEAHRCKFPRCRSDATTQ